MDLQSLKNDVILEYGLKYYDFTASGLALKSIEDRIKNILPTYANTHSEHSSSAVLTSIYYDKAKLSLKKSLELSDDFSVIACGFGSTAAIKKFQEIMGIYASPKLQKLYLENVLKDKSKLPFVLVGPYEHHSNELSFKNGVCECKRIELKDGVIDYFMIERELKKVAKNRLKIMSFSAASNVTGIKSDIKRLSDIAKKYNALLTLDCSTSSPYENIDCRLYDALFISGHKLLGGVGGCGLLVIKNELLGLEPTFAAGGTVDYVSRKKACYVEDKVALEEGGTLPILELLKTAYAFEYRNAFGLENIKNIEKQNCFYAFNKLAFLKTKISGLIIYAENVRDRLALFSINIQGISPYDLALVLSKDYGIQTRAGCACAGPYGHDILGLKDHENKKEIGFKPGWLRFNFHYIHDKNDIDYFFDCLYKAYLKLKH